jgi:hypothetical protein
MPTGDPLATPPLAGLLAADDPPQPVRARGRATVRSGDELRAFAEIGDVEEAAGRRFWHQHASPRWRGLIDAKARSEG